MPSTRRKSANIKAQRRGTLAGNHVIPLPPSAWAIVEEADGAGAGLPVPV